jgi:uncharacterized damage-inducible protein DinB
MVHANQQCLAQGLSLLDQLSDEQYATRRGAWSPVGAQYRHVLEHYQCFLAGLVEGRIDYDARGRDQTIEASRDRAREVTRSLIDALGGLAEVPADRALMVQMQSDPEREESDWAPSSVGRELQFLVSHTIHHFALIKLLLDREAISLGADFGIAPSTLSHAARAVR